MDVVLGSVKYLKWCSGVGEIEDTDTTQSTDCDSGIGPVQAGKLFDLQVCGVRTVKIEDPDSASASNGG